jgi:aspartyl-tRNA(Asn)/glutamyl-tRNA(Gln) amidotransferase subunit C
MELNREKVLHVADLAKLSLTEDEIKKYQEQLTNILGEIDKINKVEIDTDEIMISPSNNKNVFSEDEVYSSNNPKSILNNAKKTNGDYIEVIGVINE